MSLKEALERQQQQTAAAKTEEYYRRMLEEVGMRGGVQLYKDTLPIELPPEYQALIDEFVELCPPKAWKRAASKADPASVSCSWDGDSLTAYYQGGTYVGQVKLSDGSVHIKRDNMRLQSESGHRSAPAKRRFFARAEKANAYDPQSSGRERILREAQEKIDQWHRLQYGSGEYVRLTYSIPGSNYDSDYEVYLFREKNLYDLGDFLGKSDYACRTYAPYNKQKNEFEQWLLLYLNIFSR